MKIIHKFTSDEKLRYVLRCIEGKEPVRRKTAANIFNQASIDTIYTRVQLRKIKTNFTISPFDMHKKI